MYSISKESFFVQMKFPNITIFGALLLLSPFRQQKNTSLLSLNYW
ncbi:hypothetical protein NT04LS_0816 [Listeria seeligeri FSL S4-171]|nr:hypothetical protein NT04LS_0816 [Listeria seeligeri FSL S4-171]